MEVAGGPRLAASTASLVCDQHTKAEPPRAEGWGRDASLPSAAWTPPPAAEGRPNAEGRGATLVARAGGSSAEVREDASFMLYALCCMLYALCFVLYAVCFMLYALCFMRYALCFMLYALYFILYSLYFIQVREDASRRGAQLLHVTLQDAKV